MLVGYPALYGADVPMKKKVVKLSIMGVVVRCLVEQNCAPMAWVTFPRTGGFAKWLRSSCLLSPPLVRWYFRRLVAFWLSSRVGTCTIE